MRNIGNLMDEQRRRLEQFKKQRVARLQAMRDQEKNNRLMAAEEAKRNKLSEQNEMIRYKQQCELYSYAQYQLNRLAQEIAFEGVPTAEDVAIGYVARIAQNAEEKRKRLEMAEMRCKELYQQYVASAKRLKEAAERRKAEEEERMMLNRQVEQTRAKTVVQKQRVREQYRLKYLLEEELNNQSEEAKIRKAQGALHVAVEKQRQIPLLSRKKTLEGLEIIPEWVPGQETQGIQQEDAYCAAQNKLLFATAQEKQASNFNSYKRLMQDRINSKAQEAMDILEQIQKM